MDLLIFLGIGTLLSVGAAGWSFLSVIWKRQAEQELVRILEKELFTNPGRTRIKWEDFAENSPSTDQVRLAQELIEAELDHFGARERKLILHGLRQPSERGRRDYITKLVSWSASNGKGLNHQHA